MAPQAGFWDRMQDQVRTGYERTRRTTSRAVRIGILRVDLLSLRRDRTRAMAQLGERAFTLWNAGSLTSFDDDTEALRLRSLVEGIEAVVASKESELECLRREAEDAEPSAAGAASSGAGAARPGAASETRFSGSESGGPGSPQMEETHGIS